MCFYDLDSRELRTILQLLQIEEFLTLPMGYKLLLWSVSAKACGAFFRNAKILLFSIFPVWCSRKSFFTRNSFETVKPEDECKKQFGSFDDEEKKKEQ